MICWTSVCNAGSSIMHLPRKAGCNSTTCVSIIHIVRFGVDTQAADVGDYSAIAEVIKQSYEWRPIDVLICNAGLTRSGFLEDVSVEDMNTVVQTNLLGSVFPVHAALPQLKQRSSDHPISIVFVGSLASLVSAQGVGQRFLETRFIHGNMRRIYLFHRFLFQSQHFGSSQITLSSSPLSRGH